MKKIIGIILLVLLLTSCDKYLYTIEYEKCNGATGTIIKEITPAVCTPHIFTYKAAVPVLDLCSDRKLNVCDFKIVNKEFISN